MQAIISDIHSNLEALEAVLKDIESKGIKEIICLGDIIGYGPNPKECIRLVRDNCEIILSGNHDNAALYGPLGFNWIATQAIEWTKNQLIPDSSSLPEKIKLWQFIERLPSRYDKGNIIYVHASPRFPLDEYIHEMDTINCEIYNHDSKKKLQSNFEMIKKTCFIGHTHRPGIIIDENYKWYSLSDINYEFEIEEDTKKVIINVGSVGQPRDGDNRACYITFDGSRVYYHRVEYDFAKTMAKIQAIEELNNLLAERLAVGG